MTGMQAGHEATGAATPYQVDVIGFDATERDMLSVLFARTSGQATAFVPFDPDSMGEPDLYLVDAADASAYGEYRLLCRREDKPAVLVDGSLGHAGEVLERPLQGERLLAALERTLGEPREPAAVAAPEATVLVVDDNAGVRAFMQARLAACGIDAHFAESGEQAIAMAGAQDYLCVFLDVMLPGIDGFQVCRAIKSRRAAQRTAVVMLTARSSPMDRLRGSLAGCDAYLTKPLDEGRFADVVERYAGRPRCHAGRAAAAPSAAGRRRAVARASVS
ncbi:response regulator [Ramlibacter tataouinensis]|uniref:response regulator n=1 Tax=Ramlibacter tataouinensis TaxID=94132 RepID=UPI0022F3B0B0|nr:response regulator [Ramlibacter tataouinensis]WBY04008.1 response regulator [Ramlibacter tataouinensis]